MRKNVHLYIRNIHIYKQIKWWEKFALVLFLRHFIFVIKNLLHEFNKLLLSADIYVCLKNFSLVWSDFNMKLLYVWPLTVTYSFQIYTLYFIWPFNVLNLICRIQYKSSVFDELMNIPFVHWSAECLIILFRF